jgi:hypothetical protein
MENLQYPIGRFNASRSYSVEEAQDAIGQLRDFPKQLKEQVQALAAEDWEKTYRPGGWTVRQLVHHCADSHVNMYVRVKLGLTEDRPAVKGYAEDLWAELPDYAAPVEVSLQMLDALHQKLVYLMETFGPAEWERSYYHAAYEKEYVLRDVVQLYAWHGAHHLAHIRLALGSL